MAWGAPKQGVEQWTRKLKSNDISLTSLHILSSRKLSSADWIELFDAIAVNQTLTEFYASGHIIPPDARAALGAALAKNSSLKILCVGDRDFGDSGVASVGPGLIANNGLEELDLELKNVGDNAMTILKQMKTLKILKLGRNCVGNQGMKEYCSSSNSGGLKMLDVGENKLSPCEELGTLIGTMVISTMSTMERLNLQDNNLGSITMRAWNQVLSSNSNNSCQLRYLNLAKTQLGDEGVAAMDSIFALPLLSEVDLSQCGITAGAGSACLARYLAASNCKILHLNGNPIKDGLIEISCTGLKNNQKLETLHLSECSITSNGFIALCQHASSVTTLNLYCNPELGDAALEALSSPQQNLALKTLVELNLAACGVSDKGIASVVSPDVKISTLVLGSNSGITDEAIRQLQNLLPNTDIPWKFDEKNENDEEE